jgi:hypothetical protein
MKIPVFGAGVPGCNLARGSLAEGIQKNGLRIKDKFSPRMCCSLSMPPSPELWRCFSAKNIKLPLRNPQRE